MKNLYVVLIQNEEYPNPELCLTFAGDAALFETKEQAVVFICNLVDNGYPIEDYSIGEVTKVGV